MFNKKGGKMKRVLWLVLFVFIFNFTASARTGKNLHRKFDNDPVIAIYLGEVTNSSGTKEINAESFKKTFIATTEARVQVTFDVVDDVKDADVIIDADIESFNYDAEAGIRATGGLWGVVADTSAPKNSCVISISYIIKDPKTGRVMSDFSDYKLDTRLPRADYDKKQTAQIAMEKNIGKFLHRAFYEQHKF